MAKQTLDTNESGAYVGDGGTSNNAKVNANFTELYAADVTLAAADAALDTRVDALEARNVHFVAPLFAKANAACTTPIVSFTAAGEAVTIWFRAIEPITSALGDALIEVRDGDDDSIVVASVSIKGETNVGLTIAAGAFASGLYAEISCTNADAVTGLGLVAVGEYTPA